MSKIYDRQRWLGPVENDGVIIVDGAFRAPDLDESYLFAARKLIDSGRMKDLVMPIAYVQRHALELALKDLGETAVRIEAQEKWLKLGPESEYPKVRKVPWGHPLQEVLEVTREALAAISIELHQDFDDVVEFMHASELMEDGQISHLYISRESRVEISEILVANETSSSAVGKARAMRKELLKHSHAFASAATNNHWPNHQTLRVG